MANPISSPANGIWRTTDLIAASASRPAFNWYEYRPANDGSIELIEHVMDYGGRIWRDGDLDLAMGGKTGLFLFENLTHSAASRGF